MRVMGMGKGMGEGRVRGMGERKEGLWVKYGLMGLSGGRRDTMGSGMALYCPSCRASFLVCRFFSRETML